MALRLDIAPDTPNQSGYDLSKYDLVFEFSVVVRRGGSRGWLVIRCKTEKRGESQAPYGLILGDPS